MTKPPAKVLELPIEERAEMALRAAVGNVIAPHALKVPEHGLGEAPTGI
jgi:hypothetical protein